MTREQKQVLKALGVMVGVKAVLYASIVYSGKKYREMLALY